MTNETRVITADKILHAEDQTFAMLKIVQDLVFEKDGVAGLTCLGLATANEATSIADVYKNDGYASAEIRIGIAMHIASEWLPKIKTNLSTMSTISAIAAASK